MPNAAPSVPYTHEFCEFSSQPNNRGLTAIASCAMIHSSLEAHHPTARKGQANKLTQHNRIPELSRLSHAPKPSADYRRHSLGAADSRDFCYPETAGLASAENTSQPLPNDTTEVSYG